MTLRHLSAFFLVPSLVVCASVTTSAQDAPRTAWGQPDLQGVWDFRTITPMERPTGRADQTFLTDEEAANLGQEAVDRDVTLANRPAQRTKVDPTGNVDRGADGAPGSYNQFWFDRGTSVITTQRTSLVVDPPDGRIPPLTPSAERHRAALAEAREGTGPHEPTPGGWVEDLGSNGLQARCITGFNSGPPMTPGGYNNNFLVLQTEDYIVMLQEMIHEPRIIPLDGRPSVDERIRLWMGDSRGRWEGDTLVIDVVGFNDLTWLDWPGWFHSNEMRVEERFTRVGNTLRYEVTVHDPSILIQPWNMDSRVLQLNQSLATYLEDPPCLDFDSAHMVTRERG